MYHVPLALVLLVVALTMLPAPVLAQDWSQPWADPMDRPPRVDVSASGGFLMPTRWSDLVVFGSLSPATGVLEQVLTRDIHVEADTEFTGAATYWRGRYGFRAKTGFSRSSLRITNSLVAGNLSTVPAGNVSGDVTAVGIDTWLYDVGAAIGFVDYAPSRSVWPYGFIGFGGITYKLKQPIAPPLSFIERGPSGADAPNRTIIVVGDGRQFLLTTNALSTETTFAVNVGIGTDFRIPVGGGGIGVRLEVADHLAASPLALRVEELSPFRASPSDNGVRFRRVHHLSASAGLVVQIGR
jgi:hypothetical protein